MTYNRLLILPVPSVAEARATAVTLSGERDVRSMFNAYIVIIKDKTHFRCIKNRWGNTYDFENIPLRYLKSYISQYADYLTATDVLEALCNETD